jgi:hypothetical protein
MEMRMRRKKEKGKGKNARALLCLSFFLFHFSFFLPRAVAEISKGNKILIEHGLQLQGLVSESDAFHLETYKAANYTSMCIWNPKSTQTPQFLWSRLIENDSPMPDPNNKSLIALQLADERDLNSDKIRDGMVKWFQDVRPRYPNQIVYANNFGGQIGDKQLFDFITRAKPDMLCMDEYPWQSDYKTRKPLGGSPTAFYSHMRQYRAYAAGANIPWANWMQTFHAVQDYDQHVYRDPSESEMRLNAFSSLAFNCKWLIDFTYNTGASSLFNRTKDNHGAGDTLPNERLKWKTQINKWIRNQGKALVYLNPIADADSPDKHTTSMMFIRGKHSGEHGEELNALPSDILPTQGNPAYSDWKANRNDSYLRGWSVANRGKKNNGLPGDVIISWFKVLDDSLTSPKFKDEIYIMVTNGLSDTTGSAAECQQHITLDFAFGDSGIEMLQRIDRESGKIVDVPLTSVGAKRRLTLDLDGGTAELFKFKTAAPFIPSAK